MRVASIQLATTSKNKLETIEKASENVRRCKDADLIILPEIWNIGFMSFDRYIPEAEDKNGPTLTAMRQLAMEVESYLHTGSFVEKEDGKYYNSSYLISPQGEVLANYRKIHLFGFDSQETQILTPGDKVVVADTPLGKIGMATCYDLRFPELFRLMVDQGAGLFLICSAWPYPRLEHWLLLNRTRALENQCFLVSSNSVGLNNGTLLVGHSAIVDPWGIIRNSGGDDEVILKAEFDMAELETARERFPALADRKNWLNLEV